MSLNDFSHVVSTGDGPALTQVGFGTLLCAVYHNMYADMTRTYEQTTDVSSDGFSTTSAAYRMVQRAFQQSPRPEKVKLGRLLHAPTHTYRVTPVVSNSTEYQLTVSIEGRPDILVDVTSDGTATADEICDAIQAQIEAAAKGVTQGTSTTSNAVATGSKTFTTQAGLDLRVGQKIVADGGGGNTIVGTVTSYVGTTLVMNGTSITGTGTLTSWTFMVDYLTVTPDNVTATYLDLSAPAGQYFFLDGWRHDRLTVKDNTPDPGMVADLDAIELADADWYGLACATRSELAAKAAADWAEAHAVQFFHDSSDTRAMDNADVTDIASVIESVSYKRGIYYYSLNHMTNFTCAGAAGERFPYDPGQGPDAGGTYDAKTIVGVVADSFTPTQKTNLRNKKYVIYETTAGINHTLDGWTPSGTFADQVRFEDWFNTRLQEKLFAAKKGVGRLPMSKLGIAQLEACARAQIQEGITAGGIDPGDGTSANPGPQVTVPSISQVSTQDRKARHLGGGGIMIRYRYTGAINDEDVTVLVTE